MRALMLNRYSKSPLDNVALNDLPEPTAAAAGSVVVQLAAAAVNPTDLHLATGEMKMMSPRKPPFPLGVDGAGVVVANGTRFRSGDRVMFYTGLVDCGTFAERITVPEAWLAPVPADWSAHEAAAAPLALLAAHRTLERSGASPGERLLVHGAGGAVGAATVALAHHRGLVVHATGAAADRDYVERLGARHFTDYRSGSVTNGDARFDIVLDGFGGQVLDDSAAVISRGGRIVSLKVVTETSDLDAQGLRLPAPMKPLLALMFRKQTKTASKAGATLIGIASYPDGTALESTAKELVAADYRPRIARDFTLDQSVDALRWFTEEHPRGKVIVTIDPNAW